MAKAAKTTSAQLDAPVFLAGIADPSRRDEAARLLTIFAEVTGYPPRLWGASIVGFGRYAYRYESGHGGESLACGFSPRKAEISLYGLTSGAGAAALLAELGPHRMGQACLYLKRLDVVNEAVLRALIAAGLADLASRWPIAPV